MQELERDLAHALRHRADEVPSSVVARVTAVDYHPRVRRLTPRLTAGAIAGAAATTATVATVVSVVGAPAAFAGWKATPTAGAGATASAAEATCSAHLLQVGQTGPTSASTPASGSTPAWSPVATDVRGPYTLVVYQGSTGHAEATCLTWATFTSVWQWTRSATGGQMSSSVGFESSKAGAGNVAVHIVSALGNGLAPVTELHAHASGQGPYTLVEGQVPKTVTAVTLELSDGDAVQATTADGSFAAWWPGTASATSAKLTSAAGTTTEPLSPVPGPGGACSTLTTGAPGSSPTGRPALTPAASAPGGCSPGSATTPGGSATS